MTVIAVIDLDSVRRKSSEISTPKNRVGNAIRMTGFIFFTDEIVIFSPEECKNRLGFLLLFRVECFHETCGDSRYTHRCSYHA